jgi:hypothetical protein
MKKILIISCLLYSKSATNSHRHNQLSHVAIFSILNFSSKRASKSIQLLDENISHLEQVQYASYIINFGFSEDNFQKDLQITK